MKQINWITDCTDPQQSPSSDPKKYHLFIDGASRNNPGKAGIGVYLMQGENVLYKAGFYVGIKTNNEAEYLALVLGLWITKPLLQKNHILYIISDSELLIRQMKKEYKVKRETLRPLHACALELLTAMNYALCHVLRAYNKQADNLANIGIDQEISVPKDFVAYLSTHDITLYP